MQWVEEWQEIPSCRPATAQHCTVQWLHGNSSSIINQTVAVAVGSGDGSHHRGSYGGCVARLQVAIVMSGQYHLPLSALDWMGTVKTIFLSPAPALELQRKVREDFTSAFTIESLCKMGN